MKFLRDFWRTLAILFSGRYCRYCCEELPGDASGIFCSAECEDIVAESQQY